VALDGRNGYAYSTATGGRMSNDLEQDLANQIHMTHERFVVAMDERVPIMTLEQKERYFAVLSGLVSRLEDATKPMKAILQEMMAEAAPLLFREING
jgi:hypothetical protein